jgi:hypothetical protein
LHYREVDQGLDSGHDGVCGEHRPATDRRDSEGEEQALRPTVAFVAEA